MSLILPKFFTLFISTLLRQIQKFRAQQLFCTSSFKHLRSVLTTESFLIIAHIDLMFRQS